MQQTRVLLAPTRAVRADLETPSHACRVLPSLREHRDEVLLKELYKRWQNHKLMVRWLSRFFNYLDRCAGGPVASIPLLPVRACSLHAVIAQSTPCTCMPAHTRRGPHTCTHTHAARARAHTHTHAWRRYYVIRHSLHPLKDVGLLCFRGGCACLKFEPCHSYRGFKCAPHILPHMCVCTRTATTINNSKADDIHAHFVSPPPTMPACMRTSSHAYHLPIVCLLHVHKTMDV